MLNQAESYGLEVGYAESTAIEQEGRLWLVRTAEDEYVAKAVIVTAGADYNKLGVPGEERLTGRGVSYCATCDAAFFKPKMEFVWNTVVTEILGEDAVTGVRLHNRETGEESTMDVAGVFIFIGQHPNTGFLGGPVPLGRGGPRA